MEGNLNVEAEHGVIPRATQAIFKRFENVRNVGLFYVVV